MKDLESRRDEHWPFVSTEKLTICKSVIRSGEELTLETSVFQIFHYGNSVCIKSFDETNFHVLLPYRRCTAVALETGKLLNPVFPGFIVYLPVHRWRSGESTRLRPMWPGLAFQIRGQIWVEFVGSLLWSERFSPGTPVSPLLKTSIWLDLC